MVWCGLICNGVVFYGVLWSGLVYNSVVWYVAVCVVVCFVKSRGVWYVKLGY